MWSNTPTSTPPCFKQQNIVMHYFELRLSVSLPRCTVWRDPGLVFFVSEYWFAVFACLCCPFFWKTANIEDFTFSWQPLCDISLLNRTKFCVFERTSTSDRFPFDYFFASKYTLAYSIFFKYLSHNPFRPHLKVWFSTIVSSSLQCTEYVAIIDSNKQYMVI